MNKDTVWYFWNELKDDSEIKYLLSIDYEYIDPPIFNKFAIETKFLKLCEILEENSRVLERLFSTDPTLIPHNVVIENIQIVKRAIVYILFTTKCLGEFLKKYEQGAIDSRFPPLLNTSLHCYFTETTFQISKPNTSTSSKSAVFKVSLANFDELISTINYQDEKILMLPLYFDITSIESSLSHKYIDNLMSLKSALCHLFIMLGYTEA